MKCRSGALLANLRSVTNKVMNFGSRFFALGPADVDRPDSLAVMCVWSGNSRGRDGQIRTASLQRADRHLPSNLGINRPLGFEQLRVNAEQLPLHIG